jgi:hypothetical protein
MQLTHVTCYATYIRRCEYYTGVSFYCFHRCIQYPQIGQSKHLYNFHTVNEVAKEFNGLSNDKFAEYDTGLSYHITRRMTTTRNLNRNLSMGVINWYPE